MHSSHSGFLLTRHGEIIRLRFYSSRIGVILFLLLATTFLLLPALVATRMHLYGMTQTIFWSGCFSFILPLWFAIAPRICRTDVFFEPELIRLQKTLFSIPLGAPEIYPRNGLSDLSVDYNAHGERALTCRISLWFGARSEDVETNFLVSDLRRLKWELTQQDVVFPKFLP